MAGREEKVSVELDAEVVERARVQLGLDRRRAALYEELRSSRRERGAA